MIPGLEMRVLGVLLHLNISRVQELGFLIVLGRGCLAEWSFQVSRMGFRVLEFRVLGFRV